MESLSEEHLLQVGSADGVQSRTAPIEEVQINAVLSALQEDLRHASRNGREGLVTPKYSKCQGDIRIEVPLDPRKGWTAWHPGAVLFVNTPDNMSRLLQSVFRQSAIMDGSNARICLYSPILGYVHSPTDMENIFKNVVRAIHDRVDSEVGELRSLKRQEDLHYLTESSKDDAVPPDTVSSGMIKAASRLLSSLRKCGSVFDQKMSRDDVYSRLQSSLMEQFSSSDKYSLNTRGAVGLGNGTVLLIQEDRAEPMKREHRCGISIVSQYVPVKERGRQSDSFHHGYKTFWELLVTMSVPDGEAKYRKDHFERMGCWCRALASWMMPTNEKKAFILYGKKDSGKSSLMKLIHDVLAPQREDQMTRLMTDEAAGFMCHPKQIGKRGENDFDDMLIKVLEPLCAYNDDAADGSVLNEDRIKVIVGLETNKTVRGIYGKPQKLKAGRVSIVMLTNDFQQVKEAATLNRLVPLWARSRVVGKSKLVVVEDDDNETALSLHKFAQDVLCMDVSLDECRAVATDGKSSDGRLRMMCGVMRSRRQNCILKDESLQKKFSDDDFRKGTLAAMCEAIKYGIREFPTWSSVQQVGSMERDKSIMLQVATADKHSKWIAAVLEPLDDAEVKRRGLPAWANVVSVEALSDLYAAYNTTERGLPPTVARPDAQTLAKVLVTRLENVRYGGAGERRSCMLGLAQIWDEGGSTSKESCGRSRTKELIGRKRGASILVGIAIKSKHAVDLEEDDSDVDGLLQLGDDMNQEESIASADFLRRQAEADRRV